MKMLIIHGRNNPHQDMDDWGFPGPLLQDIKAVHFTYGTPYIHFRSKLAMERVREQTGWEDGLGEFDLMPLFHEDILMLKRNGKIAYYGDWEFQNDS